MTGYGEFFAFEAGSPAEDEIATATGRDRGHTPSVDSYSTPGIFDRAVTSKPCRWPCNLPGHIHADDLPSNLPARGSLEPHEKYYLSSDASEVRDA